MQPARSLDTDAVAPSDIDHFSEGLTNSGSRRPRVPVHPRRALRPVPSIHEIGRAGFESQKFVARGVVPSWGTFDSTGRRLPRPSPWQRDATAGDVGHLEWHDHRRPRVSPKSVVLLSRPIGIRKLLLTGKPSPAQLSGPGFCCARMIESPHGGPCVFLDARTCCVPKFGTRQGSTMPLCVSLRRTGILLRPQRVNSNWPRATADTHNNGVSSSRLAHRVARRLSCCAESVFPPATPHDFGAGGSAHASFYQARRAPLAPGTFSNACRLRSRRRRSNPLASSPRRGQPWFTSIAPIVLAESSPRSGVSRAGISIGYGRS